MKYKQLIELDNLIDKIEGDNTMQDNRTMDGDLAIFNNENDLKKAMKSKEMELGTGIFQEVFSKLTPLQIDDKKIGRNNPCGCGSNKKFKNCCWTGKRNK